MKKALAVGAVAVVLAVGGGAVAVHMIEKTTEDSVRDMLAAVDFTAETIRYSLLDNTLTLDNVHFKGDLLGSAFSGMAEGVSLEGFDRDSLDPEGAGKVLPMVAERLVATGLKSESHTDQLKAETSVAELRVEGWRQNLGKVAALYRQSPWSEAFFAEAYRYNMDMFAYRDYRVSTTVTGDKPMIVNMSTETLGLLGRAGSPDGDPEAGRTLSLFANGIRMDMPGVLSQSVKRLEIHDWLLPAPADMVRLTPMIMKMGKMPLEEAASPQAQAAAKEMLSVLADAYAGETPYKEIVFQGCNWEPAGKDPQNLRIDEIRHSLSLAEPFVFGLSVQGLHGDAFAGAAPELRRNVQAFVPEGLLTDASVLLHLSPAGKPSSVEWSLGQQLGRARGVFDVRLNMDEWSALLGLPGYQAMKAIQMSGGEATYTDHGLAALMLVMTAQQQGMTPQEALSMLHQALPMLTAQIGEVGPMLEKAGAIMLDKPGTVQVGFRPDKPISLSSAVIALLMQPDALGLDITATPGDKPILDFIPPALTQ